ncbi:hypothetical protein JL100_032735 (plasmid) [Skermanella mucosa]|uniref:hypothetical protein n=1 Tax=Skermanella mucosa TaxID=1789672 RepID=UPI001E595511|nr:hypothetical protein [Skermanella mucosa]UEM24392.1 hypothetical protein JL100_032735 [Skermanella mucosa]
MAAKTDPVLQRIHAHPWPRGGVRARRAGRGYSLVSTHTGAPVARLCPTGEDDEVEVLWWRRDAWGPAGPFGAIMPLDDALDFIAEEPFFWIRA